MLWVYTNNASDVFAQRPVMYYDESHDLFVCDGHHYPVAYQTPEGLLDFICVHIESNLDQILLTNNP